MQKKKNKILILLLVIIFIAIIYVCFRIFNTLKDNSKLEKEITKIKDEVIINEDKEIEIEKKEEETTEEPRLELDFEKLKKINSDTVAWIRVNNTNIDYPIVQTTNNTYYLDHSFYQEKNQNGWIYESSHNSNSFDDDNTVLFGHNTNGKTMFSELKDIYSGNYGKNINISIFLENTTYHYKVFSIYLEDPNNTTALSKYTNKEVLNNYIKKSNVNFEIDVNESDKILTFSTCNNMTDDRIIMHAKKIS